MDEVYEVDECGQEQGERFDGTEGEESGRKDYGNREGQAEDQVQLDRVDNEEEWWQKERHKEREGRQELVDYSGRLGACTSGIGR